MKVPVSCGVLLLLGLGPVVGSEAVAEKEVPRVTVTVDPRVELMCIIFRLAGNPEYCQGKVPSYVRDVDRHFGPFRNHAVVALARKLRETRWVSYDAVMSMAVHVTDAVSLQERVPFSPQPASLDARWTPESAREFLGLARTFVVETKFAEFLGRHESLYQVGIQRMRKLLDKEAHLEWFDRFFGPRHGAEFHVVLGLLNIGSYGVHCTDPNGRETLYSITGVWSVDFRGLPKFGAHVVPTIVHEITHSYTNPLVDRFAEPLQKPGEILFPYVADAMRKQAYSGWKTLMYESLVRACGLRYALAIGGPAAMQKAAAYESSRSFHWVGELAEVLGEYDKDPREYEDLAAFFPRIIAFFDGYAQNADAKLGAIKAEKEHYFGPNAEGYLGFYRQKGIPLAPVVVRFQTRRADP